MFIRKSSDNYLFSNSFKYRFPTNEILRNIWLKACKREKYKSVEHIYMCSRHFDPKYIDRNPDKKPYLRKNAIPENFT